MIAAVLAAVLAMAPQPPQEPQGPPPPPPHAPEAQALRVFLDCNVFTCDLDFLRTEITFVSYVQEPADADVHVLVTTQGTGSGGTEYTFTFIGQRRLAGRVDTLRYTSGGTDTQDEVRHGMAQVLRLGLVRYVAGTDLAQQLDIRYRPPNLPPPGAPGPPGGSPGPRGRDSWHHWTYLLSGNGYLSGESSYRQSNFSGSATATHVTDALWLQFSLNASNSVSRSQIDSVTWYQVTQRSYEGDASIVKSLNAHWSAGVTGSALQSTYQNLDFRARLRPGIEYDVFPYSETTRRFLTIRYAIGVEASRYTDTTIYGRVRETRPIHSLDIGLSTTQPWGSAFVSLDGLQYLHDTSKRELSISGNVSVRIVRGLSANWGGGYSIIHDQLFLPAAGASAVDIIARQRQLATNYSYWTSFGLSYRFGSIFNNIVNRRFGGASGGGGGMIIMM